MAPPRTRYFNRVPCEQCGAMMVPSVRMRRASRHGRGQRVSDLIPAWKLGAAYLAGVLVSKNQASSKSLIGG